MRNDSAGVLIEVEGDAGAIDELARLLVDEPPPLARVDERRRRADRAASARDAGFAIVRERRRRRARRCR